ncbi:unnamed protein product [Caenorhabditis bovis]|uniref:Uncharacterized protein n=1 Tax=Caenorhabditis bovis TaxID=2654633 RepID=A0A8S1F2W6_9PELO|nr:unnamed protein product [Caenorhabditis bovis]
MRDGLPKIAASTSILIVSWFVLYQACRRSSTIYFFELDTTSVIFMSKTFAFIFPIALSLVLYLVYHATKRSGDIRREREAAQQAEKELRAIQASSSFNSRKVSRETSRRPSISLDDNSEQQQRIRRLLSDIEEQDIESTIRSVRKRLESESEIAESTEDKSSEKSDEDSPQPKQRSRFCVESVDDDRKIIAPPDSSMSSTPLERSRTDSRVRNDLLCAGRKLSSSNWLSASQRSSRKSSYCGTPADKNNKVVWSCSDEPDDKCDIYSRLGDIDLFSYSLSILSLVPASPDGPRVYVQLGLIDILAELIAIHVPTWACVSCIYIWVLELFSQYLSFYFYYHEETMMYAAMVISILFGIYHEVCGNWITNDILAFSSIYVVCSRVQAVSYQTAVIFVIGMSIFDLFFFYVIDMLKCVTNENTAPLRILVPRDGNGNKQSVATLDIMIPGIFLNVVLKYSSMFDTQLFYITFTAVFCALVIEMLYTVWRSKTTPGMVLPTLVAIGFSTAFANHAGDLWKFMIKH